jgi:hypothetical protein
MKGFGVEGGDSGLYASVVGGWPGGGLVEGSGARKARVEGSYGVCWGGAVEVG